jgi:hypothetical protein
MPDDQLFVAVGLSVVERQRGEGLQAANCQCAGFRLDAMQRGSTISSEELGLGQNRKQWCRRRLLLKMLPYIFACNFSPHGGVTAFSVSSVRPTSRKIQRDFVTRVNRCRLMSSSGDSASSTTTEEPALILPSHPDFPIRSVMA